MNIKTQAEIEDKIYFMFAGLIKSGIIECIRIYITRKGTIIRYVVKNSNIEYAENEIGLTQEELFSKIKLKENEA